MSVCTTRKRRIQIVVVAVSGRERRSLHHQLLGARGELRDGAKGTEKMVGHRSRGGRWLLVERRAVFGSRTETLVVDVDGTALTRDAAVVNSGIRRLRDSLTSELLVRWEGVDSVHRSIHLSEIDALSVEGAVAMWILGEACARLRESLRSDPWVHAGSVVHFHDCGWWLRRRCTWFIVNCIILQSVAFSQAWPMQTPHVLTSPSSFPL